MSEEQSQCDPTEKTLYKEPHSDHYGTWQDRLYVCGPLPRQGIGIDVGGTVYVRSLKQWHGLESELARTREERDKLLADATRYRKALERIAQCDADDCPESEGKYVARQALLGDEGTNLSGVDEANGNKEK